MQGFLSPAKEKPAQTLMGAVQVVVENAYEGLIYSGIGVSDLRLFDILEFRLSA